MNNEPKSCRWCGGPAEERRDLMSVSTEAVSARCADKTCVLSKIWFPIEAWNRRAQVFDPFLRRALEDLLAFYDDVQATAIGLRSEEAWIVLSHRAKVLRQALRGEPSVDPVANDLRQALALSRETVEAMRVTSEAFQTKVWEVIEALESGIFNDAPKFQLELAHKLRHALPTETKP